MTGMFYTQKHQNQALKLYRTLRISATHIRAKYNSFTGSHTCRVSLYIYMAPSVAVLCLSVSRLVCIIKYKSPLLVHMSTMLLTGMCAVVCQWYNMCAFCRMECIECWAYPGSINSAWVWFLNRILSMGCAKMNACQTVDLTIKLALL